MIVQYGRILDIDLKIPLRPPGYAFDEFEDPHDADDAIYGRDGYSFDGYRLRVCISCFHLMVLLEERIEALKFHLLNHAVMVTSLPSSASWQDLKDHMRRAGDVCFSDVYHEVGG
ncbi:Serine/arginine-rich-splicing factor SR34 [Zea mays]|uniref:Serine/arginine-rich-splicing factor SR34 n=1 Tax=Zea mays TaxID=4577 RepID=A0A1D6MXK8_MAIZE|nr:Serine/arginine-rich-splicing factor SR34 [Zea mays]